MRPKELMPVQAHQLEVASQDRSYIFFASIRKDLEWLKLIGMYFDVQVVSHGKLSKKDRHWLPNRARDVKKGSVMKLWTSEYRIQFGKPKKKYGFWHLLLDFILVLATGGLWLLWLIIRYLRNH
jgi:hypothetical protein